MDIPSGYVSSSIAGIVSKSPSACFDRFSMDYEEKRFST